jgi:hypothetical protein
MFNGAKPWERSLALLGMMSAERSEMNEAGAAESN